MSTNTPAIRWLALFRDFAIILLSTLMGTLLAALVLKPSPLSTVSLVVLFFIAFFLFGVLGFYLVSRMTPAPRRRHLTHVVLLLIAFDIVAHLSQGTPVLGVLLNTGLYIAMAAAGERLARFAHPDPASPK